MIGSSHAGWFRIAIKNPNLEKVAHRLGYKLIWTSTHEIFGPMTISIAKALGEVVPKRLRPHPSTPLTASMHVLIDFYNSFSHYGIVKVKVA